MSPWVAAIVVVVFGAYAYMDAHIGSESPTTPSLSIETIIEMDEENRVDQAARDALGRIGAMWGTTHEE